MYNFDEYIRQVEPGKKEKGQIWQTAIGLQQVDGLKPSAYLIETAIQNIEGDITFEEVKNRIDAYYKTQTNPKDIDTEDDRTEEADKVSARIAEILSEQTFSFIPLVYINIHRRLFAGIYKFAGKIRNYNITKSEWVLDGATVLYADAALLRQTLDYDFAQEKMFDFKGLSPQQVIEHIANFISDLWQIHPFGEGNTRTTAVFLIQYLRKLGFKNINNDLFAQHSWYFRNALVRANYADVSRGIVKTKDYVIYFLANLVFGEKNDLKNRKLHIHYIENVPANDKNVPVNERNVPVNDKNVPVKSEISNIEKIVLDLLKINPKLTYEQIAEQINKNRKTVQRTIVSLRDKGFIIRVGSDKTGYWKIIN
jgi:fido (protein-threonine AMPylation protein)/predicted transcriptional regulator